MVKTVHCMIRDQPHYRADAFRLGLKRAGYTPTDHQNCDLLVVWNRYGWRDQVAKETEKRGGKVIVVENGYLGNEFAGDRWYAMSISQHNGAGTYPQGGPERWDSLGVEIAPWQNGDLPLVVLPQRGIGPPGVAMPNGWTERICASLNRQKIKHRVRQHPGKQTRIVDLQQDLAGARGVLTWGSGAALKAMLYGIPAFYDFPRWIGAPAARACELTDFHEPIPAPMVDRRLDMFRRLAWAQWRVSEIESGEAITTLVELN